MDSIYFSIKVSNQSIGLMSIIKCIDMLLRFTPTITTAFQEYSKKQLEEYIRAEMNERGKLSITLSDISEENNFLTLGRTDRYTSFGGRVNHVTFKSSNMVKVITSIFEEFGGLFAYAVSSEDNFWQNNEDIDRYKLKNKPLDGIKVIPRPKFKNKMMVDITQFPGHSHIYNEMWFGSCWLMWYGEEYYQYIDKEKLFLYTECSEKEILTNGGVLINLYDDPFKYDEEANRKRQWAFREQVGLDVASEKVRVIKRYL